MINFNEPPFTGLEIEYIKDAILNKKICGDGEYTKKCNEWFENEMGCKKALLTTSCTHALEMVAILCNIKQGDEVIMPSYTFVSTANAFALRGAKIVFVDIRPDTMNIDEKKIESAVTAKTKAIVVVHYAGVSCEMDYIMQIAEKYKLYVVEDAAQAIKSTYKGKKLGTIGDFGCLSFHETKNISCGEGGALLINNENFIERAEIIREKGTDRSRFFRGQVDKYTWVDIGSSYLPSELNAAYLYAQLEKSNEITELRMKCYCTYNEQLGILTNEKEVVLPIIPEGCGHNAHMYYIKCKDISSRTALINYLKMHGVMAVFHYIPLHSAPAGVQMGQFCGEDVFTTKESERLVRLPMYKDLMQEQIVDICNIIKAYFEGLS